MTSIYAEKQVHGIKSMKKILHFRITGKIWNGMLVQLNFETKNKNSIKLKSNLPSRIIKTISTNSNIREYSKLRQSLD
jgi:hypothetical protein